MRPISNLQDLANLIIGILNLLIPIVTGLGLLYFLWGVANFISSAGEEKKREEGKKTMWYGLIALVVMVSVWGIIALVRNTFGLNYGSAPVPKF